MYNRRRAVFFAVVFFVTSAPLYAIPSKVAGVESRLEYSDSIRQKIAQAIATIPPEHFALLKQVPVINLILQLQVGRNGELKRNEIAQSSGYSDIDKFFQEIVQKQSPFNAFPKTTDQKSVTIAIPIRIESDKFPVQAGVKAEDKQQVTAQSTDTDERGYMQNRALFETAQSMQGQILVMPLSLPETAPLRSEFERFYHMAYEKYQPLKIAKEQVELATMKIREARREFFPKAMVEYSTTDGKTITDPYESRTYALRLAETLYDSGRRSNLLKREKLNLDVSVFLWL